MHQPNLIELEREFAETIGKTVTLKQIESVQRQFLGRNGIFNSVLKEFVNLPSTSRIKFCSDLNFLKEKIQKSILDKRSEIEKNQLIGTPKVENQDCTLPSYPFQLGKSHPLTQIMEEIIEIFMGMGFSVVEGPEIESDENNFSALNVPPDHPARDMHDTFYLKSEVQGPKDVDEQKLDKLLLRTHTSPVQIRVMRGRSAPLRIIAPGKVYRHEAIDATHSSVFHQIEGLVVDHSISFPDLKGTLEIFAREFFGENVKIRFRPSYFPFVEPGVEVDISCTICAKAPDDIHDTSCQNLGSPFVPPTNPTKDLNCPVCKGSGWIEMLGAGMVHPKVFSSVGYDPEKLTGFAFGMGIERIAMVRFGINDIRLFYENHLDFLTQF